MNALPGDPELGKKRVRSALPDSGPSRGPRGYALLWLIVAVALLVGVLAMTAGGSLATEGIRLWVGVAAGVVAGAGMALGMRRDPWELGAFGVGVGSTGFLVLGIILAGADRPSPGIGAAVVTLAGIAVASGVVLAWVSQLPEVVPNALAEIVPREAILETGGVQIAFGPVGRDGDVTLLLYLQNCFDAEREVRVRLETEHLPEEGPAMRGTLGGGASRRLILPPRWSVRLGPLAVGVLGFPVVARPGAPELVEVAASVSAAGFRGRRIRRWRAPSAPRNPPLALRVITAVLFQRHSSGRSGIRTRLLVPEGEASIAGERPRDPSWQVLWTPTAGRTWSASFGGVRERPPGR